MLFEIGYDTLIDATTMDSLRFLLESHFRGVHIVAFEKYSNTSKKLEEVFRDEETILRTIKNITDKKMDIESIKKKCFTYVKVVNVGSSYCEVDKNSTRVIQIPIDYFQREINKCIILSENLSDCDFYVSLAYNAKKHGHYDIPNSIKFSFDVEHGGGMEVWKVYERRIREQKVVLCIVDSDKKHRFDNQGATSGKLKSEGDKLTSVQKIATPYILNVREKENLIPPSKYLKFSKFSNFAGLIFLEKFERTCLRSILGYIKISESNLYGEKEPSCNTLCIKKDLRLKGIGKDGLENFSKSKIYTDEFKKDIGIRGQSQEEIIDIFDTPLDYLSEDYDNLVKNIFSHTCSLGRIRM